MIINYLLAYAKAISRSVRSWEEFALAAILFISLENDIYRLHRDHSNNYVRFSRVIVSVILLRGVTK